MCGERLSLDFAEAFPPAVGAFGEPLAAHVDGYVELMGLGLELCITMRTDVRPRHQPDVREDEDQRNGDGNVVPRHVGRLAEPIHLARGEKKR